MVVIYYYISKHIFDSYNVAYLKGLHEKPNYLLFKNKINYLLFKNEFCIIDF